MYQLLVALEHGYMLQPFKTLQQAEAAYKMCCVKLSARYVALYSAGHMIREDRFPEMSARYNNGRDGS